MLLVVLLHAVAAAVVFAGCRARPRLGVALGVGVFATTALVVIVEGVGATRTAPMVPLTASVSDRSISCPTIAEWDWRSRPC